MISLTEKTETPNPNDLIFRDLTPLCAVPTGLLDSSNSRAASAVGQHFLHIVRLIVSDIANEHQGSSPRTDLVCSSSLLTFSTIADQTVSSLTPKYS